MQSSWAIGYALADARELVSSRTSLGLDWRAVFFVGVAAGAACVLGPAQRRGTARSGASSRATSSRVSLSQALGGPMLGVTVALALMNACTLFAYWGFNTWVPSYLRAPIDAAASACPTRR